MKEFLATDPRLGDFEAEVLRYERLEDEINEQPQCTDVGSIALYSGE